MQTSIRSVRFPGECRTSSARVCPWTFWCLCALLLIGCTTSPASAWQIVSSVDLGSSVVQVLADPNRPYVYAIDRQNSDILFIHMGSRTVTKRLYVGDDPTNCDIDAFGDHLYGANKGPGTGTPGSFQIAVIDLNTQTKTKSYVIPTAYFNNSLMRVVNVTAGSNGRLYYNAGFDLWNTGAAGVLDTNTGSNTVGFAGIKSKMVISSDGKWLYGQYIYTGNLGEMGVWNVTSNLIKQVDSLRYSPYPYGWDYDNYSLSGNNKYLAYGRILFNSRNLTEQFGVFPEQIYAINHDGSVAFGQSAIWDATTFPIHGNATKL